MRRKGRLSDGRMGMVVGGIFAGKGQRKLTLRLRKVTLLSVLGLGNDIIRALKQELKCTSSWQSLLPPGSQCFHVSTSMVLRAILWPTCHAQCLPKGGHLTSSTFEVYSAGHSGLRILISRVHIFNRSRVAKAIPLAYLFSEADTCSSRYLNPYEECTC